MDPMQAMPHMSTRAPSCRAPLRPSLDDQELSPPLDNPLLALQCIKVGVNPDLRVAPEEFQVLLGEPWVWTYFKGQPE